MSGSIYCVQVSIYLFIYTILEIADRLGTLNLDWDACVIFIEYPAVQIECEHE
jgi:hypothetical protein